MSVEFTPWPVDEADLYRQQGYWVDKPLSEILAKQVQQQPKACAVVDGGRQYSYQDLDVSSNRLANFLLSKGIGGKGIGGKGAKALVLLPNSAQFYAVYFALLKARVAGVYALFSHNRLEINQYLKQLQPQVLIVSGEHPLFADDEFLTAAKAQTPSLQYIETMYSKVGLEKCWLEGEETAIEDDTPAAQIASEVAFFQLSGGSTGIPKLIPRTHNDYYYSVRRSVEICQFDTNTVYLTCLPAGHNFALSSPGALGVFVAGGTVVTATDVSPVNCMPLIEQTGVNVAALVPSALHLWVDYVEKTAVKPLSLGLVQVGGAKLDPQLAAKVSTVLGAQLQQVFGMAEGLVNYTRLDDDDELIVNTQGCPMSAHDQIRVLDEQGNPVAVGEPGQLETKGPYTFRGYYQSPEHNSSAFSADGFYRTGDVVTVSEQGYLCVVGRVKDQINRGGEKIAAEEVETLLNSFESVAQSAVVSIPDPLLGEKSCAFIVKREPQKGSEPIKFSGVKVRKYLREEGIAAYKIPDRFVEIEALPLTAVGKTDKKKLRALYGAE